MDIEQMYLATSGKDIPAPTPPTMANKDHSSNTNGSPLTLKPDDDDFGILGGSIGTTATNDDYDATITTLAMMDSSRCCSWRRRRQPWKLWRRRATAAASTQSQLPMVALDSGCSADNLAIQDTDDDNKNSNNNGSSLPNKLTGKTSPTSAAFAKSNASLDAKDNLEEGHDSREEHEVDDEDDDDECGWREWTITLMSPSRIIQNTKAKNSNNNVQSPVGRDFRIPLLVANEGDLVVRDYSSGRDNDDSFDSGDDHCGPATKNSDSIRLLHASRYGSSSCSKSNKNKNNPLSSIILAGDNNDSNSSSSNNKHSYSSSSSSSKTYGILNHHRKKEDDKIALLSEHDGLGDERHGSYNVDRVDENSVAGGSLALQELPLWTLEQKVAQEEAERLERERAARININGHKRPLFIEVPFDNDVHAQGVPIQINIGNPGDQPTIHVLGPGKPRGHHHHQQDDDPGSAPAQPGYYGHADYNGDGTTSMWSADLQSRLEKQKAYQLWKYGPQRQNTSIQGESTHGELWTLPELPSEDERTSSSLNTLMTISTISCQNHQQQQQQQDVNCIMPTLPCQAQSQSSFFNELPKQQPQQQNYTRSHNISALTRHAESQSLLDEAPLQPQDECLFDKPSQTHESQHHQQRDLLPQPPQLRKLDIV